MSGLQFVAFEWKRLDLEIWQMIELEFRAFEWNGVGTKTIRSE